MKIAIFGAGNIGAAVANDLIVSDSLSQKLDSIALVDTVEQIARGKALDLAHTAAVYERDLRISGSTEPGDIADAGIVVITAGRARKAGQRVGRSCLAATPPSSRNAREMPQNTRLAPSS